MEIWPSLHIGEMNFFSKTFVHFRCVSPILDIKVSIKIQLRFTCGGFDTKKWLFFYHDFFNFTNMYLLFRPKNTSKWSHLLWKRCQKNLRKVKKSWNFGHDFTTCDTILRQKKHIFQKYLHMGNLMKNTSKF